MGDYLVTLFQQWWSAVPIDWWLAEAGRTPSLLLTQEECEVNLSQPRRALLCSAQVIWHSRFQETHLITSSLQITCTINISSYFKEILNAPVESPSMWMGLCVEVWGGKEWEMAICYLAKTRLHCLRASPCKPSHIFIKCIKVLSGERALARMCEIAESSPTSSSFPLTQCRIPLCDWFRSSIHT